MIPEDAPKEVPIGRLLDLWLEEKKVDYPKPRNILG
jgi:hypothetical protein